MISGLQSPSRPIRVSVKNDPASNIRASFDVQVKQFRSPGKLHQVMYFLICTLNKSLVTLYAKHHSFARRMALYMVSPGPDFDGTSKGTSSNYITFFPSNKHAISV